MKYTPSLIILLSGLFFAFQSHAQDWQWARGNTGSGMDGWPIATDPSGNIFVAGVAWGTASAAFGTVSVPFSVTTTAVVGYQSIITKYDGAGNVLWANGTKNGDAWVLNIAADQKGNSFMFGCLNSKTIDIGSFTLTNTVYPASQYFLAKYDPSGNVTWAKSAGAVQYGVTATGFNSSVIGTGAVTTDAAGNIYITSNFHLPAITIGSTTLTNADPSGNTNDIFLAKYDPSGNVLWAKSYGGTAGDDAYGITVTHAGDIYIAGVFGSATIAFGATVITNTASLAMGSQIAFIARFDAAGNPVWACASGGTGNEYAVGLASDINNNVYLTGGLKDNSITFSGTAIANPTPGQPVLYLVKFDPANSVSWYKTIYSPIVPGAPVTYTQAKGTWGYSIALSQCGVIWVSGAFTDSVIIDGHVLRASTVNAGKKDADPVYVAGFNSYGTYSGSAALASGGDDQNGIACDPFGNLYLSCDYQTDLLMAAGPDTLPNGLESEYLYLAKYPYLKVSADNFKHSNSSTCLVDGLVMTAPPGYSDYVWSDGHKTSSFTVPETGIYWVSSTDSCVSSSSDTFTIATKCVCGKSLFLPNSFTPNNDGENDIFYPRSGNDVKMIRSFHVYNRWGELLFERDNILPNDASNAWDGTYAGAKPLPDVYVWVVEAVCDDGNLLNKKGSVTIIR